MDERQLIPFETASHSLNSLCKPCDRCMRSCGSNYPPWLHNTSLTWEYVYADVKAKLPTQTHSTYGSFAAAVKQGCFVCNALLRSMTDEMVLSIKRADWNAQHDNLTSFCVEYHTEATHFTCILAFSISLLPELGADSINEATVVKSFVLQEEDMASQISINHVAADLTNSDSAWTFALAAMENCQIKHVGCRIKGRTNWYPTRLLDIGCAESDRSQTKLIETARNTPDGPYVTLSHCWGNATSVQKLTVSNRIYFLKQIPPLAATFEDAILATRKLGCRYLWIDCLCIIQDDRKDWVREAALMADVYQNAKCNIAATASADSNGGLFFRREEFLPGISVSGPRQWFGVGDYGGGPEKPAFLITNDGYARDVEGAPLQKRGWVLQERLLSPRILHFTRRQLVWECNEHITSECFPRGFPQAWISMWLRGRIKSANGLMHENTLNLIWSDILWRYTAANLTFRSDLLPALSGIAKYLSSSAGATYLAGIWKQSEEGFVRHLSWRSRKPAPRPAEYRAPSWSWVSTDNHIILNVYDGFFHSTTKFIETQVVPATSDPTGAVSSGYIHVRGSLHKIHVKPGDTGSIQVYLNGKPLDMEVYLDEPLTETRTMYTMPLYGYEEAGPTEDHRDKAIYVYWILSTSEKQPGCYTRCGIGEVDNLLGLLYVERFTVLDDEATDCEVRIV